MLQQISTKLTLDVNFPYFLGQLTEKLFFYKVDELETVAEGLVRVVDPSGLLFNVKLLLDFLVRGVQPGIFLVVVVQLLGKGFLRWRVGLGGIRVELG